MSRSSRLRKHVRQLQLAVAIAAAGGSVAFAAPVVVRAAPRGVARNVPAKIAYRIVPGGSTVRLGEATTIERGVVVEASSARQAEIGRMALSRLKIDVGAMFPGWTIAFLPARNGLLGMTLTREHRVEIYVRADRSIDGTTHDLAHELGHVTDVTYNTTELRDRYLELRGLPASTPWWTCNECRDLQVGAGDFAETFALIAAPPFRFYSELGAQSGAVALSRIAAEVLPDGMLRSDV